LSIRKQKAKTTAGKGKTLLELPREVWLQEFLFHPISKMIQNDWAQWTTETHCEQERGEFDSPLSA
jgi:hypothetical protein